MSFLKEEWDANIINNNRLDVGVLASVILSLFEFFLLYMCFKLLTTTLCDKVGY